MRTVFRITIVAPRKFQVINWKRLQVKARVHSACIEYILNEIEKNLKLASQNGRLKGRKSHLGRQVMHTRGLFMAQDDEF